MRVRGFSLVKQLALLAGAAGLCLAGFSVSLSADLPSPQTVGTTVTFLADPSGATDVDYRFMVRPQGGTFRIVKDFHRSPEFRWNPAETDGFFDIMVQARDRAGEKVAFALLSFQLTSRVSGQDAVVSSTVSPIVALYSAPPCPAGSTMRVQFKRNMSVIVQTTSSKPCNGATSMNFYVAGMRASSSYRMRHEIVPPAGSSTFGPWLNFATGAIPEGLPDTSIPVAPDSSTSIEEAYLLHSYVVTPKGYAIPAATDLNGNYVWYHAPGLHDPNADDYFLMRMLPGGNQLVISHDEAEPIDYLRRAQMIRELDLVGNVVRETSARTLEEQLAAFGHTDALNGFHHEIIRLDNGHTLLYTWNERLYPPGTQGIEGPDPVDVLGAYVLDLDENFRVTWVWNGFDHLDVNRKALLDELCVTFNPLCPPIRYSMVAQDWLHANSISYVPEDKSLILSLRNQDWVIKIDYNDGQGSGEVIWKLGQDGDFTINSTDPFPWFTHQHDAEFEAVNSKLFTVFDNGNTRLLNDPEGHSRGQVLWINETNRQATLLVNADLGHSSRGLGMAERLSNGNYSFDNGWIEGAPDFAQSVEVLPNGQINYIQQTEAVTYRTFRQPSMYVP